MKIKKFNFKKSLILASIMLLIGLSLYSLNNNFKQLLFKESYSIPDSTGITINNPDLESQDLNVLVIEINPIINSITNTTLYPDNNGHPKVSEYFDQDPEKALNELIEDFEHISHQYLNINVTREYLNEYPTYTSLITLSDGTKAHRFDEETYLEASRIEGTDKGDWYNFIYSDQFQEASSNSYTFDYDYIIEKYDLINRRNNGEFDQVWLLTIDPTLTYETIMIGNNPYWINAPGYKADCQNFQMANISISRRDANLHALAHGVEGIMTAAFHDSYYVYGDYTGLGTYKYYKTSYSSYEKDSINISSFDDYKTLNLWEKFTFGTYSNTANYGSVGNVHFPYNGASDYDYSNTTKVYTNWRDWLNYPNIDGNFVLDNNNAWLTNAGNNLLGSDENKSPDRLYVRFWFYLMPHITGYTEDGYLNNWWKYYHSLDFITTIRENNSTNITTELGDFVSINCSLIYNSENIDTLSYILEGNNIQISNENVLGFKDGYVYAKAVGTSDVTLNYDGQSLTYSVTVEDSTPESQTFTINFNKNTASSIGKTSDSCTTITDSCNITMPSITPEEGYQVVGWSPSKTSTTTIYTPNSSYSIKSDMTLYAITEPIPTKTYTITFDKNNASSIGNTSLSCTTTGNSCSITMPTITAPSGYKVLGWSTSKTATSASYLVGDTHSIQNDMTLYAVIEKTMKTVTITFDKNTASSIGKTTASCNTYSDSCSIEIPSITPNTGYSAVGFSTSKTATSASYNVGVSYEFSENMTLYAITQKDPVTFNVSFIKNTALSIDKTSDSCTTVTDSCNITMATITPNTGYKVIGWNTLKDATTAIYTHGKVYSVNSNMILYAITKQDETITKTISVTFDKNNALNVGSTLLTCTDTGIGCNITMPSITPKDGYTAVGFATSKTATEATYLPGKAYSFESDVTLYAITKEIPSKTFTITFNKNNASSIGKTSASCTTKTSSCEITMPTITAPNGYKVVGWSTSKTATTSSYNAGMSYDITEDMTLYAIVVEDTITSKTITATFKVNNAETISKTSDSCTTTTDSCEITMPSITAPSGYKVVGWSTSATATIATYQSGGTYTFSENVILYAIIEEEPTPTVITVTFNKNTASSIGSTKLSCTTTGDSCNITMPTITPLSGYTVVGWAETANATFATYLPGNSYGINENMTLYAITKKNSELQEFTINFNKNTASSISATELSCTTIDDSCEIKMPSITPNNGENVVGWSETKDATSATYMPEITYSISKNMTLYAITNKVTTIKKFEVTFEKNTALEIGSTTLSCTTYDTTCEITMPTITVNDGYKVIGWSADKNATTATYLVNNSYSISKNMTLYAITKKNSAGEPSGEISGVHVKTSNTATGNCVAGSELVIIDSSNNIVDKWTSICSEDNLYHQIELPDGDYTLKVATTPIGYATPSPISFTITNNKIPTPLNMPYAPIQVCLTKTTGSKKTDIIETKYEIYDELGMLMENFTLTDTVKCFPYTPVGTYTVKEVQNESGLTSTEDLIIKVLDTSEVQNFTIKTEIIVPKTAMNVSKMIIIISISFMTIGLFMVGYSFYKKYKYN